LSNPEVHLRVEEIEQTPPLSTLLERVRSYPEYFILGDFSSSYPGQYSYLGLNPGKTLVFDGTEKKNKTDPFDLLDSSCGQYKLAGESSVPVPFGGGWVGFLSYDLNRYVERLPDEVDHDIPLPLLRFGFYDSLIAWDHRENRGYLLALEYAEQKTPTDIRLAQLRKLISIENEHEDKKINIHPDEYPSTEQLLQQMQGNIAPEDYLDKVDRAIEYIKAGDIFEVNLSQRFSCPYTGDVTVLYQYITEHNPAGYAALIKTGDYALVSASPELFLSKRGDNILTRPIKGTMPRGADEQQDRLNLEKLRQSSKDRAELNMIIDLERNDLGRICRYGSVEVLQERDIEAHPTVFHTVATVGGKLQSDSNISQILRATFPGGSITGAPKIRAMEIIDELEPTARSVYTGSIGWLGVNGDLELNIAIRTLILARGRAYLQAGGAIVADSTAQKEYEETIAKSVALLKALWASKIRSPQLISNS